MPRGKRRHLAQAQAIGDADAYAAALELGRPPTRPTPLTGLRLRLKCRRHRLRLFALPDAPAPTCPACAREAGDLKVDTTKRTFIKGAEHR